MNSTRTASLGASFAQPALLALAAALGLAGCEARRPAPQAEGASASASAEAPGTVRVEVNAHGYVPASVEVPAHRPVTLVFRRTSDEGCGQQLVFPTLGIRRDLPLGEDVPVTVTDPSGEIRFTCGMDMYRGMVVAR